LSVDHEAVVTKVASYNNIDVYNKGTYLVFVESIAFNDLDLWHRGNIDWDIARIPAVVLDDNIMLFELMFCKKAGEFACNTRNSNSDSHRSLEKIYCPYCDRSDDPH